MSHGFFSVTFSPHHYRHPFNCCCQVIDQREDHSLNTIQKIFVVALALFIGATTYGIGAIPAFYLTSAMLKARNVVWMNHVRAHSGRYSSSWYWFTPRWWGFSVPVHRRGGVRFTRNPGVTRVHTGGGIRSTGSTFVRVPSREPERGQGPGRVQVGGRRGRR